MLILLQYKIKIKQKFENMGNNTRQYIRANEYSQPRAQRRFKGDRAAVVEDRSGFPEELQRTVHTILSFSQNLMSFPQFVWPM